MIARETGLEVRKLQRWNTRARPAASVPVLRPVEVVQEPASSQAAGTLQAHALRARVGGRRAKRGRVPPHAPCARVVVVGAAPAPRGSGFAQVLCAVCCFRVVYRGGVHFG